MTTLVIYINNFFLKEWGTTYFTFEEDPEPFGRVRDLIIVAMCKEMGINVTHEHSHTLYNLDRFRSYSVPFSHLGTAPDIEVKTGSGPGFALRIQAEFRIRIQ
jgi:hypothetical protein